MLSSVAYTLSAQRSVFPLEFRSKWARCVWGLVNLDRKGDADKNAELFVDLPLLKEVST